MIKDNIKVGGITLTNRIIIPPIVRCKADEEGFVTDELIDDYILHAKSGASLIVVEASFIQPNGRILPKELAIWDDKFIPGLTKLAKTIKALGVPAIIQLVHAGRMTCDSDVVSCSRTPFESRQTPDELSEIEILSVISGYGQATIRALEAGFDGVEIHCAHGYLLSQFLSPECNKRLDSWGGSLENRARLVTEITKMLRSFVPKSGILSIRFGGCDLVEGGLTLDEGAKVASVLDNLGIDLFDVSVGIVPSKLGGSRTDKTKGFAYIAERIKSVVKSPVAAVGGIKTEEDANSILVGGQADLVAVCRALLSDPLWPAKVLGEVSDPIIECLGCKPCVHYTKGCPNR